MWSEQWPTLVPSIQIQPLTTQQPQSVGSVLLDTGDDVLVIARLMQDPATQLDAGQATNTWSATAGLGLQQKALGSQTISEGFTDSDRASLQSIESWTALDTFITSLTVESLGTSPLGGSIDAELPDWRYGIIVRVTTLADGLVATTPDLDYFVKSLAVVRVFRGTDILLRVPIHRSSQIIPLVGNGIALQIAGVGVELWAPGLSLEVDFLAGCAGEVLLMKLP